MDQTLLEKKATWLRRCIFDMLCKAKQGHPGSTISLVEILAALFYGGVIRYEHGNADASWRDRIIISKGHAAMALYPIFSDLGYFDEKELDHFGTSDGILRIFGNINIPGIDATCGSLGHGFGIGIGYAMAAKYDDAETRVFVVISEGEMYEGSVWEGALLAAHHKLDNLVILLDRNRKIILGDTEDLVRLEPITDKWESFGFKVLSIDGHSFPELIEAFSYIGKTNGQPLVIVANTVKGKGIPMMEHEASWHYWQGIDEDTIEQVRQDLLTKETSV